MADYAESWKDAFLVHLRQTANVSASAKHVGITRNMAMQHKRLDPEFRERWFEAIQTAVDDLEMAGRTLALSGNPTMIIFMLKSLRPSIYKERLQIDMNTIEREAKRLGLDTEEVLAELDEILTGTSDGAA